jgi:hypothetical protein
VISMNKKVMFFLAALLFSSLNICIAETYTTKTGPFSIQVQSDEDVYLTPAGPYQYDDFNIYDMRMEIGRYIFDIEIHDYGHATDITDLPLVDAVDEYWGPASEFITPWRMLEVGGKPGITASIEKKAVSDRGLTIDPAYIAAYSPDGFGNRGSVIAIIVCNAEEETFKENKPKFENIVKNLRIIRE